MAVHRLENAGLRMTRGIETRLGDQEMFFLAARLHSRPLGVMQFFWIDWIH